MSPATVKSYIAAAGLIGLAVYLASTGQYGTAVATILAAFGVHSAANSGPAS